MRGFRRRFRARGRKRMPVVRQTSHIHNVLMPLTTIASNTTSGEAILNTPATVDEDPDHTIISNGTTIAECDAGARITKVDLTLEISCAAATATPFPVAFIVWKDAHYGAITAPTTADDVFSPSTTLQLATLKKNTCQYEKFLLTVQGDRRRFHLRVPRRLRRLMQGEGIKISISNLAPDTNSIVYTLFGKIVTTS